jgi:ethanolamine utilization microcompartment shell protein EutL
MFMKEKSNVAVVDFQNPRDAQGNIVLFLTTEERAKQIAAEAYEKALKNVLERAASVYWPGDPT